MSEDVRPDDLQPDDPAVRADDEAVERLRQAGPTDAVVWGDDEEPEEDPALELLSALMRDVTAGADRPLADVVPLRRHRPFVRGSAVAACALGLLTVGGVAAASPGSPLYAVKTAVSAAVGSVVGSVQDAVTPPAATHGRTPAPAAPLQATSTRPTVTPATPPARSLEAARLVGSLLDRAQAQLTAGHLASCRELLDAAERHLPEVAPEPRAVLATRLGALRISLAQATPPGTVGRSGKVTPRPHATPTHPVPGKASKGVDPPRGSVDQGRTTHPGGEPTVTRP